ncbi:aryl-sulfate sulfotransferase [Lewinella sp. W8]|uniref:aryl-sulfate sulfotransferase n=1 Tax=Lewinella sp. W8 TaxID=2528208 RepID=UPI001068BA1A|nr:aryl-sulfate sulfotransferase [Lewinella sp. W8]MTB50648.1 aryl-sulfate sulfotransferase [Lewinella sp. W8]
MKQTLKGLTIYTLCFLFLVGCNQDPRSIDEVLLGPIDAVVNPYGRVPLGAELTFRTEEPCWVSITVPGDIPVTREFPRPAKNHSVPVLGLYPGQDNPVEITLTTESGTVYTGTTNLTTQPLPATFPEVDVTVVNRERMESGFHLMDLLIANDGKFLPYTVLFDDRGTVRWFMDMSENGQITYTTHRLSNGNWLYLNWIDILEVDDLGKTIRQEQMWGNAGNHEVLEMPNDQLLMGGSKKDSYVIRDGQEVPTRFDHVVLWDRKNNRTVRDWDMREVLDVDRSIFPGDYGMNPATDWFHVNSITVDPADNGILVSGRNQGVVKVNQDNQLQWIFAPLVAWDKAGLDGKGLTTSEYLLRAVDANGNLYPPAVQQGVESAEDFDWPMGQHALNVLPNGNLLLFDNGLRRNYQPDPSYSRAVEYQIDAARGTVTQVWEYGKQRGLEMYSPITSDVDDLPVTGNRLITSGNVRKGSLPPHAKMVEVTYPDNEVVFEANIFFKDALGSGEADWAQFDLVFRGERYDLIPPTAKK